MKISSIIIGLTLSASAFGAANATTNLVKNGEFTQVTRVDGQLSSNKTTAANSAFNTVVANWSLGSQYGYMFDYAPGAATGVGAASQYTAAQHKNITMYGNANGTHNGFTGTAPGGGNILAMAGDTPLVTTLNQTISGMKKGQEYYVKFDYAFAQEVGFNGVTHDSLLVGLGNKVLNNNGTTPAGYVGTVKSTGTYTLPSHGFTGWQTADYKILGTSSTEILSFLAQGGPALPPFALLADVSVTAVPEASTWIMMLAGFAGLGLIGFRRTKREASALSA